MWSDPNPAINEAGAQPQDYVYPPPLAPGAAKPASSPGNSSTLESLWGSEARGSVSQAPSEEQIRAREACARKQGWEEAAAKTRAEYEKGLSAEREKLAQAIREFMRERETYFGRVEAEVVGLALAIARKILHREAQVDPLLLAGVVRVGLEQSSRGNPCQVASSSGPNPDLAAILCPTTRPPICSGADGGYDVGTRAMPPGN